MLNKETVETITSKRRLFHLQVFFNLPPRGLMISFSGLALLINFENDSQSAPERRLGYEKLSALEALVGIEQRPGVIDGVPMVSEMTTMEEEKIQTREANVGSVI